MWVLQHFTSSALSLGGGVPRAHSAHRVHAAAAAPCYTAGSVSRWRGLIHACYGALMFLLDLVPGGVARFKCSGNVNSGAHQFLRSWIVLSALRELSQFPSLLYSDFFCLLRRCSIGSQLSLRRNCSKYRSKFNVFS